MSYTLENTKELFLVIKEFSTKEDRLHIIMSKKEVQEELKSQFRHTIVSIHKLTATAGEEISPKYFLPKNWEKINQRCEAYHIWKKIAEGEK